MLLNALYHIPLIFVGGKGGTGKTTHAASLACRLAANNHKVLLISTDPAHSLGDILQTPLSHQITTLTPWLHALELDPQHITRQHFDKVEATIAACARPDMLAALKQHLNAAKASPGGEEAAILEALCHYIVHAPAMGYQQLIFDTAPTGHTLRLLDLPKMMTAWTDGLLAQQGRQQRLRDAALPFWQKTDRQNTLLSDASHQRWQQALQILQQRRQLFSDAAKRLASASQTSIILVMTAEALPLAETRRAFSQLQHSKLPCTHLIINQIIPPSEQHTAFWQQRYHRQQTLLAQIHTGFTALQQHHYALQANDIRGINALIRFGEQGQCHPEY